MKAKDGGRWNGVADFVLDLRDLLVLIDHKTSWSQLNAYRRTSEAATGKPVAKVYVYFLVLSVAIPLPANGGSGRQALGEAGLGGYVLRFPGRTGGGFGIEGYRAICSSVSITPKHSR